MLDRETIESLLAKGCNVVGPGGEKIGSMDRIYADDDTGEPTWAIVKTGLFGASESFVPVEGARTEGGDLMVSYTKEQVQDAPQVEVDGHITPEEEEQLYSYYERCAKAPSAGPDGTAPQGS